jgi:hypothetical protein
MTTPADRRAIAKIAANARWARETNRSLATAKAHAKGPGSLVYWIARVDPTSFQSWAIGTW